jgi:hypothetical protein
MTRPDHRTAEADALQRLRDSIIALGLPAHAGVTLLSAATTYAKAMALRIADERDEAES